MLSELTVFYKHEHIYIYYFKTSYYESISFYYLEESILFEISSVKNLISFEHNCNGSEATEMS